MPRPRLNLIRTFEAAGRHLSFTRAAEELHISPPAVSQQIRQLEGDLGRPLFHRHHRRLSLTDDGAAYLAAVQAALGQLDQATDRLFAGARNATVAIRCPPSIATLWLAPRLGDFHRRHPGIDLRIRTLEQGGEAGPALEILKARRDTLGGTARKLLTSTITPVCAPGLLAPHGPLTAAAQLLDFELIHVIGYDDDWPQWFRRFGPHGAAVPQGLATDGSLIAIEAAVRGDGVMLGRRPFIDGLLQSGDLVEAFANPHCLEADYCIKLPAEAAGQEAWSAAADWLIDLASCA